MRRKMLRAFPLIALTVISCSAASAEEGQKALFNAATIVLEGRAETNGVVEVEFHPNGSEAKLISVSVVAEMKDADIAQDIWKELSLAAGQSYKLQVKGGNRVSIEKAAKETPLFSLEVKRHSVAGVSILIRKEK